MTRSVLRLLCACLVVLVPTSGWAELSLAVGGDAQIAPTPAGHGILLADWRAKTAWRGAVWNVTFNTDTLRLAMREIRLADDLSLDFEMAGEGGVAGLLTDYYQAGERVADRGFAASWLGSSVSLSRRIGESNFVRWGVTPRHWIFAERGPEDFNVLEQSVSFSHWRFQADRSQWQRHHWFQRLSGFGFGVAFEHHLRDRTLRWDDADPRNQAGTQIFIASQWAALGVPLTRRLRVQVSEEARVGFGEDDLTRQRIGGMVPYSVHLAGAPWPAFLSSRVVAGQASLRWNILGETEVGVLGDVVMLDDPRRAGEETVGEVVGVGLSVDARVKSWQLDARFGVAPPSEWLGGRTRVGAFVGLGRAL